MRLFANDSSLFAKVNSVHATQQKLSDDLNTITRWANQWKMKFNPDITKQAEQRVDMKRVKSSNE